MPMPATAMQAEATPWRLRATISHGKVLTAENTEMEHVPKSDTRHIMINTQQFGFQQPEIEIDHQVY